MSKIDKKYAYTSGQKTFFWIVFWIFVIVNIFMFLNDDKLRDIFNVNPQTTTVSRGR
jgi:hypothetical protein